MKKVLSRFKPKNIRPGIFMLSIPITLILAASYSIGTGAVDRYRLERFTHDEWRDAASQFDGYEEMTGRKFAYYEVKEGETTQTLSRRYGIAAEKLQQFNNTDSISPGETIKIPPVERPLTSMDAKDYQQLDIVDEGPDEPIKIKNERTQPLAVMTLVQLADLLESHDAIERMGERTFLLNRTVEIDTNVRLEITEDNVDRLLLRSEPNDIVCLCGIDAEMLIDGVNISSYDPNTQEPDTNPHDERSFIRMRDDGRMDILRSDISYLGNGLLWNVKDKYEQINGGTYGISWRISDETFHSNVVTGWVEDSKFHHNHFGGYSFGASGMMWKDNHFYSNDVYGLDPHDDSNNALIVNNVFEANGKHGFIVSKRCNFNVIRNNRSFDNELHGFMLHEDSQYNLIAENEAYNNHDNVVVTLNSNHNVIKDNELSDARGSNVRINDDSQVIAVVGNDIRGGDGIKTYGNSRHIFISDNRFHDDESEAMIIENVENTVVLNNLFSGLNFRVASSSQALFGPNDIH